MKKWLFALGAFALLVAMMLGEVLAANYNHSITLKPNYYGSAKVHLNEGDTIRMYAVSVDESKFKITIFSPFGNDVFSQSSSSVVNRTYAAPATGEYKIDIYNPSVFSDVTVGYTITRSYRGHFGITRHQDIRIGGSEF
ncbi:MAG: hypothetical protein SVE93_06565 [Candidatus Thermoplasmatota archaeon]|nr:hypothetical protein [Candidatus Thermoplasmatota archaeon]